MTEHIHVDNGGGRQPSVPVDLPSNSYSKKSPAGSEKKINPIQTSARIRKVPLQSKIKDTFVGEPMKDVGLQVLMDVIVPAIKDLIFDSGREGLSRILYGATSRPGPRPQSQHTSYGKMSMGSGQTMRMSQPRSMDQTARATHDFGQIIFDSKGEAEAILDSLLDLLTTYDMVSVSDLYEIVGMKSEYTDRDWGWTSLAAAGVDRTRDGYILSLPKTRQLK